MEIHGIEQDYRVDVRRGPRFQEAPPWAALEGRTFRFRPGPVIGLALGGFYGGEMAMLAVDPAYPPHAPRWIASGDLVPANATAADLVEQAR